LLRLGRHYLPKDRSYIHKQLIWRGQAKGFVDRKSNPKKDDKLVNEAVRKILKNFPPR